MPDGGVAASATAQDDVCREQRLALDKSQSFTNENIAKAAVIGAIGGALISLATGGNAGQVAVSALAAGAGAAVATAYWESLQKQKIQGEALYGRMNGDMTRELENVNKAQAAYNELVRCRKAQATQIRGDFVSGNIDRATANTRMAQVKALAEQDYEIAKKINARVKSRTDNFVYATQQATGKPIPRSNSATINGTPAATEAGSLQCCSALQASNTNFEQALVAPKQGDFSVN